MACLNVRLTGGFRFFFFVSIQSEFVAMYTSQTLFFPVPCHGSTLKYLYLSSTVSFTPLFSSNEFIFWLRWTSVDGAARIDNAVNETVYCTYPKSWQITPFSYIIPIVVSPKSFGQDKKCRCLPQIEWCMVNPPEPAVSSLVESESTKCVE